MQNQESNVTQINNDIMGYGKKIQVLTGKDENGKEKVETFHFTPVSLHEIPSLGKKLDEFFNNAGEGEWNEKSIKTSSEIIQMSLKKIHSDITIEYIQEVFTLGALAKAVSIIADINDFLSQMEDIQKTMTNLNKTGKQGMASKKN